jgi:hypothetical protein
MGAAPQPNTMEVVMTTKIANPTRCVHMFAVSL